MTLCYMDKSEKGIWLPRLFDLLYENMASIAPSDLAYEAEKAAFIANVSPALDKAPRQVLLALDGQTLAGYVQFYTRGELLMVEELQLGRAYRAGSLFLSLARKLLADLPEGIATVEAYADRRNRHSLELMARLGMEAMPEEDPRFLHLRGDAPAIRRRFSRKTGILSEMTGRENGNVPL